MADPTLPPAYPICLKCLETKVKQAIRKERAECQTCKEENKFTKGKGKVLTDAESKLESEAQRLRHLDKEKPVCDLHPSETITHYCSRCKIPVCIKCAEESHEEHKRFYVYTLKESAEKFDRDLASSVYNRQFELCKSIETMKNNWAKMKRGPGTYKQAVSVADAVQSVVEEMRELSWQDNLFQQKVAAWEEENRILSEKVKDQGRWKPREVTLDY